MSASSVPRRPQTLWPLLSSAPLELGQRVGGGGAKAVGLGPDHVGIGAQLGDRPRPVAVVRDDDLDAGDPERALERDVGVRPHVRPLGGAQARAPLEDDPVGVRRLGDRRDREGGDQDAGDEAEAAIMRYPGYRQAPPG